MSKIQIKIKTKHLLVKNRLKWKQKKQHAINMLT